MRLLVKSKLMIMLSLILVVVFCVSGCGKKELNKDKVVRNFLPATELRIKKQIYNEWRLTNPEINYELLYYWDKADNKYIHEVHTIIVARYKCKEGPEGSYAVYLVGSVDTDDLSVRPVPFNVFGELPYDADWTPHLDKLRATLELK